MSDTENAKTVLITGANGLWGMSVTRSLLKRGHRVFALVRDSTAIKHENLTPVPADLATSWDVCCLPRRADVVIHLAQSNRFRDFPEGSEDVFNVNISTTAKLLDYARRASVASSAVKSWCIATDHTLRQPSCARSSYTVQARKDPCTWPEYLIMSGAKRRSSCKAVKASPSTPSMLKMRLP